MCDTPCAGHAHFLAATLPDQSAAREQPQTATISAIAATATSVARREPSSEHYITHVVANLLNQTSVLARCGKYRQTFSHTIADSVTIKLVHPTAGKSPVHRSRRN